MYYDIYYTVKAIDKSNDKWFELKFNSVLDKDDVFDTYVLNPMTGQWNSRIFQSTSGWSEMDQEENKLVEVIYEATYSPEWDIVYEFETEDIDKEYRFSINHRGKEYEVCILCEDVIITD